MVTRIDYATAAPKVMQALYDLGKTVSASGLEPELLALVEMRASQMNRCAFCLALHDRQARALELGNDRIAGIAAWRDASWYTARERAALEWTEALTAIAHEHPCEDLLEKMRNHFSESELAYLSLAVCTINTWNRFNVGFHVPPERAEATFKMMHPQNGQGPNGHGAG